MPRINVKAPTQIALNDSYAIYSVIGPSKYTRVIHRSEAGSFIINWVNYREIPSISEFLTNINLFLLNAHWPHKIYKVKKNIVGDTDWLFAINTSEDILIILEKDLTFSKAINKLVFDSDNKLTADIKQKKLLKTDNVLEAFNECEVSYRNSGEAFLDLL